ncbi:MAG TPA: outer membrane protein assembly factor BamA [Deltaproteobacteria bacterium]|nr:outer membrane protein assembly factor BamA [Deltaproteobacteria bacterium]
MTKRILMALSVILLVTPNMTILAQDTQVMVLPFDVHSLEDLTYLKTEISKLISNQLKSEGAVILNPPIVSDLAWRDKMEGIAEIRRTGVQFGADYVIWGSMTRIGKQFSLDAKMLESYGEGDPLVFFLEGEGMENLVKKVRELSRNLERKLFKQEVVAKISISGNQRIEADAIRRRIKTEPGSVFAAKDLTKDLKSIYAMGYFEDIRIETEDSPEGKIIIFKVKEKSTIRYIRIKKNRVIKDEEILEAITIKTGSILNIFQLQNNVKIIEELYKDKNYHNVEVTYEIQEQKNNQADLDFTVNEGGKVQIKEIAFVGNQAYTDKKLKGIMKTSEKGFFSWLTSSGELNKENLTQDVAKLTAYYQNNGYIQAKVGDPQTEFKENWIYITIKIDEGPRFKVGTVDIKGDLVLSKAELLGKLKINDEEYFNRETLRSDVLALTDVYADEGYAYANVAPLINKDLEKLVVDIVFEADKGKRVHFERIIISGNTRTRDKVIRRQLKVYEQDIYSGRRLKQGVRSLHRLDYFEDVKVNTTKGSTDDSMILKIDVKEKPTGAFTFGGGYSGSEGAFVSGSVTQRNLFGRGQTLALKADIGEVSNRFTLSFTEPWLFDMPLSGTANIYDWTKDFDTYEKDSYGFGLRFGYPVFSYTRATATYEFENADIRKITADASDTIKDLEGTNIRSSIAGRLQYDSTDKIFMPSEGSEHSGYVEWAGLGGDIGYIKLVGDTGWYFPLFWGTIAYIHGKVGWTRETEGMILPDYEKFYLGGLNSLRGFDFRDVSAVDDEGKKIGGEKFVQLNLEYIFPLIKKAGLQGVVFFDTGDVYRDDEDIEIGDLRQSVGWGVRWNSPIGPFRLEQGFVIDPRDGEDKSKFGFSIGGAMF